MQLSSTGSKTARFSWKEAVLSGLAPDGHLFVPVSLPTFSSATLESFRAASFSNLALTVAQAFLNAEVEDSVLQRICDESFDFSVPLVPVTDRISVLELFHGPTCAFKDFGARFMARLFRHFLGDTGERLTVLVATSGDTGSAVANAFFDPSPNAPISVTVLFPKGKVSLVQEKQMTTLGHNVRAFEVEGTFDDCQRLVKSALADPTVTSKVRLTSANSINIARLLPQSFYYLWAQSRLPNNESPLFSVPSGNLGNITGGAMAHLMGMPAAGFIAAHNQNDSFPRYLSGAEFKPQASVETVSNAMDVGNPSNFARLSALYNGSREALTALIHGVAVTDEATIEAMRRVFESYGYMLDPHGAIGFLAAEERLRIMPAQPHTIVMGTAHPAKFPGAATRAFGRQPAIPSQLRDALDQPGLKEPLCAEYTSFRTELLREVLPSS